MHATEVCPGPAVTPACACQACSVEHSFHCALAPSIMWHRPNPYQLNTSVPLPYADRLKQLLAAHRGRRQQHEAQRQLIMQQQAELLRGYVVAGLEPPVRLALVQPSACRLHISVHCCNMPSWQRLCADAAVIPAHTLCVGSARMLSRCRACGTCTCIGSTSAPVLDV